MKTSALIFTLFLLFLTFACNCPECTTPPESIALRIVDNPDSTDLIFTGMYSADTIAIYYIENDTRKEIKLEVATDSINNKSVIYSHEIGWVSAAGEKEFFLYLNHHETDTVYLDYEEQSDRCCSSYLIKEFSINDVELKRDNADFLYYYFK